MCAIRVNLTIIMSIRNEARFKSGKQEKRSHSRGRRAVCPLSSERWRSSMSLAGPLFEQLFRGWCGNHRHGSRILATQRNASRVLGDVGRDLRLLRHKDQLSILDIGMDMRDRRILGNGSA